MARKKFSLSKIRRRSSSAGKIAAIKGAHAASRARAKARQVAEQRMGAIIGIGAAAGVGALERKGTKLPTVAGLEPTVLYGGLLTFVAPSFVKGKVGGYIAEAGAAIAGIAAYKLAMGTPLRSGEDVIVGYEDEIDD